MLNDEELSAYIEGDVSESERERISALLANNHELQSRHESLLRLRDALGSDRLQGPRRDLWESIAVEVSRPRWWELSTVRLGLALTATAATILVVTSFVATETPSSTRVSPSLAQSTADAEDRALVDQAQGEFDAAKEAYLSALGRLEQRAEPYVAELPEESRLKLRTSLFEVEQAIARVETVLRDHPNDPSAHKTLVALYDQKMRVLKGTVNMAESFYGREVNP